MSFFAKNNFTIVIFNIMREEYIHNIRRIINILASNELVCNIWVDDQLCDSIELIDNTFQLNIWEKDYEICVSEDQLSLDNLKDILKQLENLF